MPGLFFVFLVFGGVPSGRSPNWAAIARARCKRKGADLIGFSTKEAGHEIACLYIAPSCISSILSVEIPTWETLKVVGLE